MLAPLGTKIALIDLYQEKAAERADEINDAGGVAQAFGCDVTNEEQVKECYKSICDTWHVVPDCLINAAGGNDPRGSTDNEFFDPGDLDAPDIKSFFDLELAGVRQVLDLNFLGTFITTRVFSRGMAEQQRGSIVNISSMSAFTPLTKVGIYSAAKAAVSNFTRWLAVHFSHVGVRVNALAPGFFMTEQLRFLHVDQETGELTPRAKKVVEHTPMGRYGEPEELAGTVIWLLSDASTFVTGAVVPIDGGFSSYAI
jgi:NAD(P)-dependent dehydrogenase (short-subunit alcohol dehydrogenase family)